MKPKINQNTNFASFPVQNLSADYENKKVFPTHSSTIEKGKNKLLGTAQRNKLRRTSYNSQLISSNISSASHTMFDDTDHQFLLDSHKAEPCTELEPWSESKNENYCCFFIRPVKNHKPRLFSRIILQ